MFSVARAVVGVSHPSKPWLFPMLTIEQLVPT